MSDESKVADLETIRGLLTEYDAQSTVVEEKRTALNAALLARSEVVKKIAHAVAPKKKIVRNGRQLTIVNRNENYFFRGAKEDDSVEI